MKSERQHLLELLQALDCQEVLSVAHWQAMAERADSGVHLEAAERAMDAGFALLQLLPGARADGALRRLAWRAFAAASLIDPGMADAYAMLFGLAESAPEGVSLTKLDLLEALVINADRVGEEQRRTGHELSVAYVPLAFDAVTLATPIDAFVAYACELLEHGRLSEAKAALVRSGGISHPTAAILARIAYSEGRYKDGVRLLSPIINAGSRSPLAADAYFVRAACHLGLRRSRAGIADLRAASERTSDNRCRAICYEHLSRLLSQIGDEGEAHLYVLRLRAIPSVQAILSAQAASRPAPDDPVWLQIARSFYGPSAASLNN